jgi:hypothetical protein
MIFGIKYVKCTDGNYHFQFKRKCKECGNVSWSPYVPIIQKKICFLCLFKNLKLK